MAQSFQYRSALRAADDWTEVFNTDEVRKGTISLTTLAEHLNAGTSTIVLDDPDSDLGHDGDTILAHHRFELIEDDHADEHAYIGFIGQRKFSRGDDIRPSLRVGVNRQIELTLFDLNCIPSFRVIDPEDEDADRPEEPVDDRLAWILGSDYLLNAVFDDGVIESNTTTMDAVNYGGQTAANVIADCEIAAGFGWNAWIYYIEDAGHYSLGFINANTSTLYSSSIRISNLLSDIDTLTVDDFETGTTFFPLYDGELTKDPANLISGVYVPYQDAVVFRQRTATSDVYGPREQSAPNSNVKTAPVATRIAEDYLDQHATDSDNIHVAIQVPTSKANAIKAGQRLEVKFTHLPGYESFTWCRVIRRTIIQEQAPDRYILDMDLSPQEAAAPAPGDCTDIYANTPSGTYSALGGTGGTPNPSDGVVYYWRGGLVYPSVPDPGYVGGWHFSSLGVGGTIDYAGDCSGNRLILMSVGNGTWTITPAVWAGSVRMLEYRIKEQGETVVELAGSDTPVEIVIDDATDGDCIRRVEVSDTGGACGGKWGFHQAVWVAA